MPNIDEAIEALLAYEQADMEGVMVLTSRQAIHEVADELRHMRAVAQCAVMTREQAIAAVYRVVESHPKYALTQINDLLAGEIVDALAAQPPAAPVETEVAILEPFATAEHRAEFTAKHGPSVTIQTHSPSSAGIADDPTAEDREYASELLADLANGDLPRLEIAARWFRKARIESEPRAVEPTADMVDAALNAWFKSPPSETDQGLERSMKAALVAAGLLHAQPQAASMSPASLALAFASERDMRVEKLDLTGEAWASYLAGFDDATELALSLTRPHRHVDDPGLAHPDNSDSPAWAVPSDQRGSENG